MFSLKEAIPTLYQTNEFIVTNARHFIRVSELLIDANPASLLSDSPHYWSLVTSLEVTDLNLEIHSDLPSAWADSTTRRSGTR